MSLPPEEVAYYMGKRKTASMSAAASLLLSETMPVAAAARGRLPA
jgi:hypothetical protein